jgi:hypothetical protein
VILSLFWTGVALAAAPGVRVAGVDGARALTLLIGNGEGVAAAACNDAGGAPDDAPDGVWTCGPLPPTPAAVRLALVRDGRLLDVGESPIPPAGLALVVTGSAVALSADLSVLPAPRSVPAAPRVPTVVARVVGLEPGPSPVVRLRGSGGETQLACRDDGSFPDAVRNDGQPGCAGAAPGAAMQVLLNGADGQAVAFGDVSWDPGAAVGFLTLHVATKSVDTASFALLPFGSSPDAGEAPGGVPGPPGEGGRAPDAGSPGDAGTAGGLPPAGAPPAGASQGGVPPAGGTPVPPGGVAPAGTGPQPAPESLRAPVGSRAAAPDGLGPPLAVALLAGLGLVGGWVLVRSRSRLPASLRVLPAPPLLPGGPTLADHAVAVQAADVAGVGGALLLALAHHRRVVVVASASTPLPLVGDGPVYTSMGHDCEEVEAATRALARTAGPAVAVLVLGDILSDDGAVAPAALRQLREGLPVGVWLGVVTAGDLPEGLAGWVAEGPPWALAPAPRAILAS